MYFSNEALKNMTDMELSVGLEAIQAEISKREKEKREYLINKFYELWREMETAHICITYCEPDTDTELYDWNNFSFS